MTEVISAGDQADFTAPTAPTAPTGADLDAERAYPPAPPTLSTPSLPAPSSFGETIVAPDPLTAAVVKGRIKVADEVVEKVAALAALEVSGVADLGGDLERAFESVRDRIGIGSRRANQGTRAQIQDRQVAVDVMIVVEYGHVVMDVANEVKTNVARSVSRMLGLRVVEVNVTVDDVRMPGDSRPEPRTIEGTHDHLS